MKLKIVLIRTAMAMALAVSGPVVAAEAEMPTDSLGAIGAFAAYEKLRIFSEACGELAPEHKAEFDAVIVALSERMKRIGADVLASGEFRAMTTREVPRSLVHAFEQDSANAHAMYRARVNLDGCMGAHANFKSAPDAHWALGISSALTELRATGEPFAPAPHK